MAYMQDMTVLELFLKSILATYYQMGTYEKCLPNPYNALLKDVLAGRADLKCVMWYQNRRVLEDELNFPKVSYDYLQEEFCKKALKNILQANNGMEIFRDLDRNTDFIENVQRTMNFYVHYKLMRQKERRISNRI